MEETKMQNPRVTVIVVPRERFSYTRQSLESIYDNTESPFTLVYVDGGSPTEIKHYLQMQSIQKGFKLIRTNHYLSPNQARNIGLSQVDTEYIVFIDNDVLVKPGWLSALIECAEETGAWAVSPLCLQGDDFKTIHMVGGKIEFRQKSNTKWMIEHRPFMTLPLEKVEFQLVRQPTELIEFHCMLVRTKTFEHTGLLDEKLMSMAEETDFCLSISKTGNSIYFEPTSVISYVPPSSLIWSDLPFFFTRWSNAWCEVSVNHFRQKWNLGEDAPALKHYRKFVYSHRLAAFGNKKKMYLKLLLFKTIVQPQQSLSRLIEQGMEKVT
jgi:GT2 family glycosyltransferase